MKKTNTHTPIASPETTEASGSFAGIEMPFKQVAAFETIMAATGNDEFTAAGKVISIGLFVLGLDLADDHCLFEMTDALFGKGSDDSAEVHNSIVDTGSNAHDARINRERDRRRQAFAKAATAQVSA